MGKDVILGVRPEHIQRGTASPPGPGTARYRASIELVQPTGSRTYITFSLAGKPVVAEVAAHDAQRAGELIDLDFDLTRAILMDAASGAVLGFGSAPTIASTP